MINISLHDFYLAARDIVIHQRLVNDRECDRINSFVVVNSKFDFGKDDVAERRKSPYFFSRDSSEIIYPALFASESYPTFGDLKNERYQRNCHVLELGVIDQLYEDCSGCSPCKSRDVEKIKIDTTKLLQKILNEFNSLRLYLIQPGDVYKLSVQGVIDEMIAAGKITSATEVHRESMLLKKINRNENASKKGFPYTNKAKQLYGMFVVLTFCDICNDLSIEYKFKTIEQEKNC